jgi:dolichol-phosphate mannosyltransferase
MSTNPKLSVVLPMYNEAESLPHLFKRLREVLIQHGLSYEIIAVNDGSRDATKSILEEYAKAHPEIKVINFGANAGQTAALRAGIEHAKGEVIVTIDSDLENNPEDIPRLLKKMEEERYDVVSGWRADRWAGEYLMRKLPSMTANMLISKITGVPLHDYGCTLKVYKRSVIAGVPLYGEMHRFIPAYASWRGARVTELKVTHTPRQFGVSKYGFSRTYRVLLDLLLLKFLHKYKDRPMHFFGGFGFILMFLGLFTGTLAIALRLTIGLHLVQTPLPVLTALLLITGLNLALMGIVAEMLMRTYYESKGEKTYIIGDTHNL